MQVPERTCERLVIVPVAGLDVPAERAQLRCQIPEREDLFRRLVGLQLVAVDDCPEVSDSLVGRGRECLPVLPLL